MHNPTDTPKNQEPFDLCKEVEQWFRDNKPSARLVEQVKPFVWYPKMRDL